MNKIPLLILALLLSSCGGTNLLPVPPTASPNPTLPPTATPIPGTPTPVPTETLIPVAVPGGPCDNPLLPLATGNSWVYRVTSGSSTSEYSLKVLGRQDTGNVVTVVEYTDRRRNFTKQDPIICQEGAIENFPLLFLNMLISDALTKYLDTYHYSESADYVPDFLALTASNWVMEWQPEYLIEDQSEVINPLGSPHLYILTTTPVDLVSNLDGSRMDVSTPAGDFQQAFKVSVQYSFYVTIQPAMGSNSGMIVIKTTGWHKPYVGLVSAQVDSATVSDIPIPILSSLELVEFTPGNQPEP
jgi:hypothetical protein